MNGEFSSTSDLKSSAHSRLRVFLDSESQGRAQTGIVEGGAKMTRVLDEKTRERQRFKVVWSTRNDESHDVAMQIVMA